MTYNGISKVLSDLIERRIEINLSRGNSKPVVLTIDVEELKERMGLDRLKTVTRDRVIDKLEDAGYDVTFTGHQIVIKADPAQRDCLFESIEDLEQSLA